MSEKINNGKTDKIERYGWIVKDEPGILENLDKDILKIDHIYQRDASSLKVSSLASEWSWLACGAILVAMRNNDYYVFDGQHRVLAARSRSDIKTLPCIVFAIDSIQQEAIAFLDVNARRSSVPALGKYKALIATNDKAAITCQSLFDKLGVVVIKNAKTKHELRAVSWCLKKATENESKFLYIFNLAYEICEDDMYIPEKLLDGLWGIDSKIPLNTNKRMVERIKSIGGEKLTKAATKAVGYYGSGGTTILAQGMMEEINKGLKNRFEF